MIPHTVAIMLTNFYMHEKQYFRHTHLFCTALQHQKIYLITSSIASGGGGGEGDVKAAMAPTLPLLDSLPFKGDTLKIIQKCCSHYFKLGIQLLNDEDGTEVKRIEMGNNSNPEATMRAIFAEWLQSKDCSWKRLIACLRSFNLNSLAKSIENALIENKISF